MSYITLQAPGQRWRPAQRVITNGLPIPSALADNLMSRDIGDGDYDLLLQLDKYVSTCINVYTQHRNFPLVCTCSAGQPHLLIHISMRLQDISDHFTSFSRVGHEFYIQTLIGQSNSSKLVPNFYSLYSPRSDDLVHNYTYLAVLTFFSL